jgi:hypothetical protein
MLKSYQHDKEDSQQNLETKCPPVVGNDSLDLYTLPYCSSDTSSTALCLPTNVVALSIRLSGGLACLQCKVFTSIDTCHSARSWRVYVVGCYGQSLAYRAAISFDVKLHN